MSKLFLKSHIINTSKHDNIPELIQRLNLSFGHKLYAILIIIPLFLLSFMGFSPFVFWIIPLSLIIRIYVLTYFIKRLRLVCQFYKIDNRLVEYIQIAGISIIVIASIAMTEAYLVYSGQKGKMVTLHYSKGEIIKTDSSTLYLGKSQYFYYLYSKKSNKAIIIKADQIDKVEIE